MGHVGSGSFRGVNVGPSIVSTGPRWVRSGQRGRLGVYGDEEYVGNPYAFCSLDCEPETALKIKGHVKGKKRDRKELCGVEWWERFMSWLGHGYSGVHRCQS